MTDVSTAAPSATPSAPPPVVSDAPAPATPAPAAVEAKPAPATEAAQGKPAASFLGDEPAAEAKPGEAKPQGETAPAEIKITLPEGTSVDEHLLGGFVSFAKEAGLTNETANKVAGWYAGEVAKQNAAMEGAIERHRAACAKEIEADKELGGVNLTQTKQNLANFQRRFGTEEFRADAKKYGFDNLLSFVRLANAVGAAFKEDDASAGGSATSTTQTAGEAIHAFYPNSTNPDGSLKR